MPLEGTLNDLSLPSLIQLQCSERRRSQVRLAHAGRTGELIFAEGELIHARVATPLGGAGSATLTGDAAVYELLTWEGGEFHVSDGLGTLPARTVNVPANALLLEGLRQLDEKRAGRNEVQTSRHLAMALETALSSLKSQPGLRGALVVDESGHVRADATDGTGSADAELIAFVIGRAQATGATLSLGAFQQLVCTLPSEKTLIEKIDEAADPATRSGAYLAAWLDARASLDPLKALRALKNESGR